ncbi:carbonic anhydrase family protein [Thiorhodococcus mannitoliphagus]|uniref:carbonic anhydrase n=1 Tax=Thiorhodococcus mannitoliphagus TaxID=329406 RepID=A0A6P1E2H3_9GAMM|nr:carbonic anhydrase family protein [Thiorhodococcus mannitoliphagus]NEX22214.1 carbonic anhydrase family protein [Thiorhodococcus mannitoliphagus]
METYDRFLRCRRRHWRGRLAVAPVVAGLLTLTALSAAAADATPSVWSYEGPRGPEHWGGLSAAYKTCADGRAQSPIDVGQAAPLGYTPLVFQYRSHLLEIVNTGNGVQVITPPGSALLVRGSAFDLERLDFHVPGEHRFNGAVADAEIQLVHRDSRGGFVIVAVPLKTGQRENRILSRILDYFPMKAGERVRHRQVGINPLFLLPSGRGYYRYEGSLTIPPCEESVLWYVMREPLIISSGQLERMREAIGFNARPLQALNGREVKVMGR